MLRLTCRQMLRVLGNGDIERVGLVATAACERESAGGYLTPTEWRSRCGRFRKTLLFRLNTIEFTFLRLRDRPGHRPLAHSFSLNG